MERGGRGGDLFFIFLTFDDSHAVDVLAGSRVGSDVDTHKTAGDGLVESGIEAHFGKTTATDADAFDVPQFWNRVLGDTGGVRSALRLARASPLNVTIGIGVGVSRSAAAGGRGLGGLSTAAL